VAASFVVNEIVVEVVPAERFVEGEPPLLVGGVVSGAEFETVTLMPELVVVKLPASLATAVSV
jgi:hypothetical protein